jgi:hypothetical protein
MTVAMVLCFQGILIAVASWNDLPWVLPFAVLGLLTNLGSAYLLIRRRTGEQFNVVSPISFPLDNPTRQDRQPSYARFAPLFERGRHRSLWQLLAGIERRTTLVQTLTSVATVMILVALLVLHISLQDRNPAPYPRLSMNMTKTALPAALFTGIPVGKVMTVTQASAITRAVWRTRETALVDRQFATLGELENGGAKEIDQGYLRALAYGQTRATFTAVRPADSINVYIPARTTYPTYFAAAIGTSQNASPTAASNLMILAKSSPSDPWMISFIEGSQGSADNASFPKAVASQDGTDAIVYNGGSVPSTWLSTLTNYYVSWKDNGHAPSPDPFDPGFLTNQKGQELTINPQGSRKSNYEQHFEFIAPSMKAQWSVGFGAIAMTCGYIDEVATDTAGSSDLNQDYYRFNWGPQLAPGQYRQIVTTWVYPVCVYPDLRNPGHLQVFGMGDSPAMVSGVS